MIPIHEFQCYECGLKFEKLFRAVHEGTTYPCKNCGEEAKKLISQVNHTFAHVPTGPVPQNTGVSQLDHKADRIIGRDAEERWKAIEARQKYKQQKIADESASGFDLSRTPDGDYRVMDSWERGMSERARSLHNEAMKQKPKADAAPSEEGSS